MNFLGSLKLALLLCTASAHAFEGEVSFTAEEITQHAESAAELAEKAGACIHRHLEENHAFYEEWGVVKYYGNQSWFFKSSEKERIDILKGINPELPASLEKEMKSISCIDLANDCLREAFEATKQFSAWKKIRRFLIDNGKDVTALQQALHALGWKVLYWNADPSKNKRWDTKESILKPFNFNKFWGYHEYRHIMLERTGRYNFNDVDDKTTLTGFKKETPEYLKNIPFWIGSAHTGYHAFTGTREQVVEGHSKGEVDDKDSIESAPFNPYGGGSPLGSYRSGLIAVPPGF